MSVPFRLYRCAAVRASGVFLGLVEPPLDDRFERSGVDVVELVPALAPGLDQAGGLENVEVLRDRLPRRAEMGLGRQAGTDVEQPLAISARRFVKDDPARV